MVDDTPTLRDLGFDPFTFKQKTAENQQIAPTFTQLQREIVDLSNSGDPTAPQKISELKLEREKLILSAEKAGVFDGLKEHIDQVLKSYPFLEAQQIIQSMSLAIFDTNARARESWNSKFEGMLDEYRNVWVLQMMSTRDRVNGSIDPQLEHELSVRSWKPLPPVLEKTYRDELKAASAQEQVTQPYQLEMMRNLMTPEERGGFGSVIATMLQREVLQPTTLSSEYAPGWYQRLSEEWQEVVMDQYRMTQLVAIKWKQPGGALETLAKAEGITIRAESLEKRWNDLPGFRVALLSIMKELFVVDGDGTVSLTDRGARIFNSEYRKFRNEMIKKIKGVLQVNQEEVNDFISDSSNPPVRDVEMLSRYVVADAMNIIFMSGLIESADKGRKIKNPHYYNPAMRSYFHPRAQAIAKFYTGADDEAEGDSENFGGKTGIWIEERMRNDANFRRKFLANRGMAKIFPDTLFPNLLEYFKFNDGTTIAAKLMSLSNEGEAYRFEDGTVMYDPGRDTLGLLDIVGLDDMWGTYADTLGNSWTIWQAINGYADPQKVNAQTIGNYLSKLRKTPGYAVDLNSVYSGETGFWLAIGTVIGRAGAILRSGDSSSVMIDGAQDYEKYNAMIELLIDDDRMWPNREDKARARKIFKSLDPMKVAGNTWLTDAAKRFIPGSDPLDKERKGAEKRKR